MPTYLYECPVHGEFEHQHSIKEELEFCPHCLKIKDGEEHIAGDGPKIHKVRRLIAGGGSFILGGSGWARDNYS